VEDDTITGVEGIIIGGRTTTGIAVDAASPPEPETNVSVVDVTVCEKGKKTPEDESNGLTATALEVTTVFTLVDGTLVASFVEDDGTVTGNPEISEQMANQKNWCGQSQLVFQIQ